MEPNTTETASTMGNTGTTRTMGQTIRSAVVREASRRTWLYVGLVDTDWRNWEDERECIRAGGAVDALMELARERGFSEDVQGAEAEGKQRLREHMLDRQHNGPARLEELEAQIETIEREVPMEEYKRDSAEREDRGYYGMRTEKLSIEGDLEIAELTIRHLDGEDIELG